MNKLVLLLLLCFFKTIIGMRDVFVQKIEALIGENVYLPCNVTSYEGDEAVLVLWYRDDKGTPIYSVDMRAGISKAPKRWSDEAVFANRAFFIFENEPGKLSVDKIQASDSGVYRCRVDFLKAQTYNRRIRLDVITPPKQILIRDSANVERSTVVGPYSEGDIITLKCQVVGGYPTPSVTWSRDGIEIPSQITYLSGGKVLQSELSLGPLQRNDLNSRLVCKALNHPKASSVEAVVQIDMNFAPLNIRLLGAYQPLSAGRRYDLLCQSAGSRPPAVITWWQNGIRLEKTTETTSSDGNQTTSTLSINLSKTDSGKFLSCKAYNHAVPSDPLEDGWKLDIQYIPEAYVRLGTSLEANALREGTDVYFDCLVIAHPQVFRIEWRHNDHQLLHNISQGIIISNHSLVLQGVTRATAGNYSCVGFNAEGEGISEPFNLNILYAPTCAQNQPKIYGVAKQEDAQIKCVVDANPQEVDFSWTFNNSAESIDVATNHISRIGTTSIVTYTPITELDYGTLLCIATNKIGRQRIPCVFHIIAAGRPDQVHNCTILNISMTSLTATCSDGFNGGLPQLFILELQDANNKEIKANITSTVPRFTVSGLHPGNVYILSIFAYNSKGRSDPTVVNAAMLRMPEKQLTFEQTNKPRAELLFSPMVSLTIGLTLAVFVASLAIVLALRIPCAATSRRRQKELSNDHESRDASPGPSDHSVNKDIDENDERNPDVVPELIDYDDQVEYTRKRQHISTIDTSCNPCRNVLINSATGQHMDITEETLCGAHSIGYCTLRSGRNAQNIRPVVTLPMNVTPHVYSNVIAQCTLPRQSFQNEWPPYTSNAIEPNRVTPNVSTFHQLPISAEKSNTHVSRESPEEYAGSSSSTSNSSMISASNTYAQSHGRTIALHHMNQSQTSRACMGAPSNIINTIEPTQSDDEATVQTPLMIKRDSSV
ncbi:LOW QUALITY PROTEIN: hemicentin-1 [Drosophila sulfurigaster albostrigata]|uniref:LOW QUALITY PROTEIN: hemicentin-1 n=1 Tax=Drosophila sulfurigaster albostrigata TaxID=89887 RepID=UPI002D21C440|nr:LOW QUALITY PROTEIN: hemicentin-1 [Drosophila sulfurigaster albostrigata]